MVFSWESARKGLRGKWLEFLDGRFFKTTYWEKVDEVYSSQFTVFSSWKWLGDKEFWKWMGVKTLLFLFVVEI